MIFFNLTNGIEALTCHKFKENESPHFIRIQSTWCEQKRWKEIILDLDYTFLMACRIAKNISVIDYSANKAVPRAIYQGLPWIQYVLNRYWYNINEPVYVKGCNCTAYFEAEYNRLIYDKTAKFMFKKLDYFRKFDGTGHVLILHVAGPTKHDGNYKFYNTILRRLKI